MHASCRGACAHTIVLAAPRCQARRRLKLSRHTDRVQTGLGVSRGRRHAEAAFLSTGLNCKSHRPRPLASASPPGPPTHNCPSKPLRALPPPAHCTEPLPQIATPPSPPGAPPYTTQHPCGISYPTAGATHYHFIPASGAEPHATPASEPGPQPPWAPRSEDGRHWGAASLPVRPPLPLEAVKLKPENTATHAGAATLRCAPLLSSSGGSTACPLASGW